MSLRIFISFFRVALIRALRYRFNFIMSFLEGLSMLLINLIFFSVSAAILYQSRRLGLDANEAD